MSEKSLSAKIIEIVQSDPERYLHGNYNEIADKLKTSYGTVRNIVCIYRQSSGMEVKKQEWTISGEMEKRKENAIIKSLHSKNNQLTN